MNRDEQRHRHEAGIRSESNLTTTSCYPVDGQAGGTWAGMNANGVAMALLNRYQEPHIDSAQTRGKIIVDALAKGGIEQVGQHLQQLDCAIFNPFDLLIISRTSCHQLRWNGQQTLFQECQIPFMISSSSERLAEVLAYRQQLFASWQQSGASIDRFHLQQANGQQLSAVLMSRDYSHTKSLVQIRITEKSSSLSYYDETALTPNASIDQLKATEKTTFSLAS